MFWAILNAVQPYILKVFQILQMSANNFSQIYIYINNGRLNRDEQRMCV